MVWRQKIFISYDYDKDRFYKNLLQAWDQNKQFDFSFRDESVDVSINSDDENYIKQVIRRKISQSDIFLCLIGENTWRSNWVNWEIKKAFELRKPIVAIKIQKNYLPPAAIMGVEAVWAYSFSFDSLREALAKAG